MARPSHRPSRMMHRRLTEAMVAYGVSEADIAGIIGIDAKTLRKHYRGELDIGHVRANLRVSKALLRQATGDGHRAVTAAIFWLKTRAGWRDRSGAAPLPAFHVVRRIVEGA